MIGGAGEVTVVGESIKYAPYISQGVNISCKQVQKWGRGKKVGFVLLSTKPEVV